MNVVNLPTMKWVILATQQFPRRCATEGDRTSHRTPHQGRRSRSKLSRRPSAGYAPAATPRRAQLSRRRSDRPVPRDPEWLLDTRRAPARSSCIRRLRRLSDTRLLTWNTGTCCGYAQQQRIDEIAFVRALLDTLQASYPVDPKRIFATGHLERRHDGAPRRLPPERSHRGHRGGVRRADDDCAPKRPVSVLIIHGTADENLPYNGGVGRKALDKHDVRPVSYAVDSLARARRLHVATGRHAGAAS